MSPVWFCLLISIIFRWEFECNSLEKVGLLAGRYSGTSRPDLYRTPQALHNVLGPIGPARHWGVFSARQCWHLRPIPAPLGGCGGSCRGSGKANSWDHRQDLGAGRSGNTLLPLRRFLLRGLTGQRTGTWKVPQQLMMMGVVVRFSRTDTGLLWFSWLRTLPEHGLPGRISRHVSTPGNASLFDNHSKSSSTDSCGKKKIVFGIQIRLTLSWLVELCQLRKYPSILSWLVGLNRLRKYPSFPKLIVQLPRTKLIYYEYINYVPKTTL